MKIKPYIVLTTTLLSVFAVVALTGQQDDQGREQQPRIIANISLPNQTGPILQTPLFTAQKAGVYRVSAYAEVAPGVTTISFICGIFRWPGEFGVPQQSEFLISPAPLGQGACTALNANGLFPTSTIQVMHLQQGTTVNFATPLSQDTPPPGLNYSLYFVIESL